MAISTTRSWRFGEKPVVSTSTTAMSRSPRQTASPLQFRGAQSRSGSIASSHHRRRQPSTAWRRLAKARRLGVETLDEAALLTLVAAAETSVSAAAVRLSPGDDGSV
jgi:hypothetical protein